MSAKKLPDISAYDLWRALASRFQAQDRAASVQINQELRFNLNKTATLLVDANHADQRRRRSCFQAFSGTGKLDLEASDRGACGRYMGWGLLSGVSHDD